VRTLIAKWIIGCAAFVSPVIVAVIGRRLDHSAFRHDVTYETLIPGFVWGSLALAALAPAILALGSRAPVWQRVSDLIGVWRLLLFELYNHHSYRHCGGSVQQGLSAAKPHRVPIQLNLRGG